VTPDVRAPSFVAVSIFKPQCAANGAIRVPAPLS
jgi:hypothetical protein